MFAFKGTYSRRQKGRHLLRMGRRGHAYRILVGKPEEKKLLGKSMNRWGITLNGY